MKKTAIKIFLFLLIFVTIYCISWYIVHPVRIAENLYLIGDHRLFIINLPKLTIKEIYSNPYEYLVRDKYLIVDNQKPIFGTAPLTNDKNIITAWISNTDIHALTFVEINTQLEKSREYPASIQTGSKISLVNPVKDMRLARGGDLGWGGSFNKDTYIWIIPHVEPLAPADTYFVGGLQTRYTETLVFPVLDRSLGVVKYLSKSHAQWVQQPIFEMYE